MTWTGTKFPVIEHVYTDPGIAGQRETRVEVRYEGEDASGVSFIWSIYGGPVVMRTPKFETFVSERVTDRLGHTVDTKWIEGFFRP